MQSNVMKSKTNYAISFEAGMDVESCYYVNLVFDYDGILVMSVIFIL